MANQKCECGCGKVVLGKGRMYFRGHKPKAHKSRKSRKPKANGHFSFKSVVLGIDHEISELSAKLAKLREARKIVNRIAA